MSALGPAGKMRAGEVTAVDVVSSGFGRRRSGSVAWPPWMPAAAAEADVLVMSAADESPPWRESATADQLWTLPWSLNGGPAVVVACGGSAVQVVGRPWQGHVALAAAAEIERARNT